MDINKYLLKDEQIKDKLEKIQPEGFDWVTITDSEMIKFKAIAKAQLDAVLPAIDEARQVARAELLTQIERYFVNTIEPDGVIMHHIDDTEWKMKIRDKFLKDTKNGKVHSCDRVPK